MNQYKKCKCCGHTMASVYFTHKAQDCLECMVDIRRTRKLTDLKSILDIRAYLNCDKTAQKGGVK